MLANKTSYLNEDIDTHIKRLDAVLKSWKMKKKTVVGDGNCCFRAVAYSRVENHKRILDQNPSFFVNLGISNVASIIEVQLATKLREATVTVLEWQSNTEEYEGFLTASTVSQEAQAFLQSGHFNSDLGDTVLLALSNALSLPIIVFTSIPGHSIINIIPKSLKIAIPIHLAYLQHAWDGAL